MSADDLQQWFEEQTGIIARWSSSGPRRTSTVPEGLRGLSLASDVPLVKSGTEIDGEALLVRSRDFAVGIAVPQLRDATGFTGTFTLTLRLTPPRTRTAALLLRDHGLKSGARFSGQDLAAHLTPILQEHLEALLDHCSWDGVGGVIEQFRKRDVAENILAEPLFELGLELRAVSGFAVDSETLEKHRQRESELRREGERVRDRLEFLDLWKKEEVGAALARADVEKLAAHLSKEGLLRELQNDQEVTRERLAQQASEAEARGKLRRMLERERIATQSEIDEERLEFEIERATQLKAALEKHGLLAIVDRLGDSPDHARLLELLVEREISPEQLRARSGGERLAELESRLAELAAELRSGAASGLARHSSRLPEIGAIWLAAGLALYRISGDAAFGKGNPTPVLPPEDLGHLRSVNVSRRAGDTVVQVGAQLGVAVYRPAGSYWSVHRYQPPPQGRGGANSVVVMGNRVLATHSELGLCQWQEQSLAPALQLFSEQVEPGRSTRGIQLEPAGGACFAHGEEVFRFTASGTLTSCGMVGDSVTALCARGGQLVVGTRDGRLFQWSGETAWREMPFRTSGPVFRIMAPGGDSPIGWVIGARQAAVHVLDRDGELLEEYCSRYPIRWVAAGRQGVLGVDRFGQELLVWQWEKPGAPVRRIRVPDQIQSLDVELRAREEGA